MKKPTIALKQNSGTLIEPHALNVIPPEKNFTITLKQAQEGAHEKLLSFVRVKNILSIVLLPCSLLIAPMARAQLDKERFEADKEVLMTPVVVTAGGRAQAIQDVQASVQVINQNDLKAFSGVSITESLRLAIGVDARPTGSNASISMRGFSLRPGALLVDGLRRPGKYGEVNPNLLELENVERIEVIRGPMSALYGADATGGAINIITRSPLRDTGTGGSIRGMLGETTRQQERKTAVSGMSLHFGTGDIRHQISAERRYRGLFRYDASSPTADLNRIDQTFASYNGGIALSPDHTVRWTFEHVDQDDSGPGVYSGITPPRRYTAYERERRNFGALRYMGAVAQGVLEVDLAYGTVDGATTRSYPLIEKTDYQQSQLRTQYSVNIGEHALLVGAGAVRDDIELTNNRKKAQRDNTYALLQDEWSLPWGSKVLAGVRHDRFTDFGSVTTPRLSLQHSLGLWTGRVGYGEAYRAPSVIEQYSTFTRGSILIVGNPDLKAETNRSWETALAYRSPDFETELVYFKSKVDNLIQTVVEARKPEDSSVIRSRNRYINIARADLQGTELSTRLRVTNEWSLLSGWEYMDAKDAVSKKRLAGHSRHTIRTGLRYEQGAWRTDVIARYYFDYYNTDPSIRGSTPFNSNFGTTDIKVRYQFDKHLSLSLGLDNVFGRRQPVNFGARGATFDPPDRFAYLGARYEF